MDSGWIKGVWSSHHLGFRIIGRWTEKKKLFIGGWPSPRYIQLLSMAHLVISCNFGYHGQSTHVNPLCIFYPPKAKQLPSTTSWTAPFWRHHLEKRRGYGNQHLRLPPSKKPLNIIQLPKEGKTKPSSLESLVTKGTANSDGQAPPSEGMRNSNWLAKQTTTKGMIKTKDQKTASNSLSVSILCQVTSD